MFCNQQTFYFSIFYDIIRLLIYRNSVLIKTNNITIIIQNGNFSNLNELALLISDKLSLCLNNLNIEMSPEYMKLKSMHDELEIKYKELEQKYNTLLELSML